MKTARFFVLSLFGNVLPIIVALVSVPVIAQYAGVERLGALGIVSALVGYFGFLDFGLSRVVTRRVAEALEHGRLDEEFASLRGFLWLRAMPALAIILVLLYLPCILLVESFPAGSLRREMVETWGWIALSIPVTLLTNWLRGALEGVQRFARLNLMRVVFGTWNYAAPAVVVALVPTLEAMIIAIVVGRVFALLAHLIATLQVERAFLLGPLPCQLESLQTFFMEGGWMTVSNIVGPLMVYLDRFVLGAVVSAKAVAWYVTAQEIMLRTLVIPGSLASVLFPRFSGGISSSSVQLALAAYRRGIRAVAAMMLPVCVIATMFAYDGIRLWMDEDFSQNSHHIVEVLAIGIFANSIAQVPFALLQGLGRADKTAKLHLVEFPLYSAGLYFSVVTWGVTGAAWMWTFRVITDCIFLLHGASLQSPPTRERFAPALALAGGVLLIAMGGLVAGPEWGFPLTWRLLAALVTTIASILFAWFLLLDRDDRSTVLRFRHAY